MIFRLNCLLFYHLISFFWSRLCCILFDFNLFLVNRFRFFELFNWFNNLIKAFRLYHFLVLALQIQLILFDRFICLSISFHSFLKIFLLIKCLLNDLSMLLFSFSDIFLEIFDYLFKFLLCFCLFWLILFLINRFNSFGNFLDCLFIRVYRRLLALRCLLFLILLRLILFFGVLSPDLFFDFGSYGCLLLIHSHLSLVAINCLYVLFDLLTSHIYLHLLDFLDVTQHLIFLVFFFFFVLFKHLRPLFIGTLATSINITLFMFAILLLFISLVLLRLFWLQLLNELICVIRFLL